MSDGVSSSSATVSIAVLGASLTAEDDRYEMDRSSGSLTVGAPGVLGNDISNLADKMTARLDTGPANGSVAFNADGGFTYTPNAHFVGSDSFTYDAVLPNGTCKAPSAARTPAPSPEVPSPPA